MGRRGSYQLLDIVMTYFPEVGKAVDYRDVSLPTLTGC